MRRAERDDWGFIQALYAMDHVRNQMHAPTEAQFGASLRREHCFNFVVSGNGEPFGNLKADLTDGWLLTISALAVRERRKGAGRFALRAAIGLAFGQLGAHRIFLEIVEANVASRRLCESVGFRPEGVYRDGYCDETGEFHNLIPYGMLATDAQP
ncbi:MAG TPA: GNAT family N-acetyltransferase [Candidatus Tumulicola sp.]|nr:GNAT family N-acetyltransferase [Candidatus Tumulicola sp.]